MTIRIEQLQIKKKNLVVKIQDPTPRELKHYCPQILSAVIKTPATIVATQ